MANLKVLNKELYRKGTCREEEGSREEGEKTGEGQLEDRPTTLCFQDTCPSTLSEISSTNQKARNGGVRGGNGKQPRCPRQLTWPHSICGYNRWGPSVRLVLLFGGGGNSPDLGRALVESGTGWCPKYVNAYSINRDCHP
ncbi:hypothetical protein HPP92_014623 [Vanilla planifolia]|uniref:Uncharacterized protein n=1 Tax=Vanilla planifolia TaxID=51239 RepID=A0A835UUX8_VANPL|nr:hypothetical protein HPP92_014623 [Vanilla planifolia]